MTAFEVDFHFCLQLVIAVDFHYSPAGEGRDVQLPSNCGRRYRHPFLLGFILEAI